MVIYKHEKDMLRMFDLDLFQRRILERLLPEYKDQNLLEKEKTLKDYLKTIEEDYDEREMDAILQDGFAVTDVASKRTKVFDPDAPLTALEQVRLARRKKKNSIYKDDFYKTQIRANKDREAILGKKPAKQPLGEADGEEEVEGLDRGFADDDESGEELFNLGAEIDEDALNDPDFLKKRKAQLAANFQREIQHLQNKKLKGTSS